MQPKGGGKHDILPVAPSGDRAVMLVDGVPHLLLGTGAVLKQHREWCNSLIQGQIDEHSEAVGEAIATYSQRYLETDISALQGEVAALRSDVANLQNELQRIASRLDTIEYERSASNVIDIRQPGAKPA